MSQTLQSPRETVRAKLPHYLEPKEIEILIEYAADSSQMAANFMLTMWRAGLRVSEAINLQARDLRFKTDRPQIHIRNAKGHKERFVPAHPELQRTLTEHCRYMKAKGNAPLFIVERSGQKASRQTGYEWVVRALNRAKLDKVLPRDTKVTPHTFRHSAARHWLAQGVQINTVQLWLGHSNLDTTLIYLALIPDAGGVMENIA
jgi:integrase/recombinase XerD|tara:strand:- start:449 stop:1057 length:609 start_codon:yes stop_codon:yes gene_type:complete